MEEFLSEFGPLEVPPEAVPEDTGAADGLGLPGSDGMGARGEDDWLGEALMLPQAKRPRFEHRSAASIAHARAARATQLERAKREAAEASDRQSKSQLSAVCALLPGVAQVAGQPSGVAVGRKKVETLRPQDFAVVVRALHLPTAVGIRLGVNHARLLTAGAKICELRQVRTLARMLNASADALVHPTLGANRSVHTTYVHMWDEVQVKFRWKPSQHYRSGQKALLVPTMVQRGVVSFTLTDKATNSSRTFSEYWLSKPAEVEGTSGAALLPALRKAAPRGFLYDDLPALRATCTQVRSHTFMPLGDSAGSNLLIMKFWGHLWFEEIRTEIPTALYWPDTCGVHHHHRAKVQLAGLRRHTMRHYSISTLNRQHGQQARMVAGVEALIADKCKRKVGPPPECQLPLKLILDVLYDLGAPHHNRKGQAKSQRHSDLVLLGELVNHGLEHEEWVHWCWDEAASAPCCPDEQTTVERTTVAAVHALLMPGDPLPAESRWTNVLANYKTTLLRKVLHGVGIDCFSPETVADEVKYMDADSEGLDDYFKHVLRTRARKTKEYYSDKKNFHELGVYVCLLEVSDSTLLYPLLGDTIRNDPTTPSKLDLLLDPDMSLVATCASELLKLLQTWRVGGRSRRPWCLLEALKAPFDDPAFAVWTRSQVLRLNSALFRRHELRLSAWPYRLYTLASNKFSQEDKCAVAREVSQARREVLDTYSLGVRGLYPNPEQLLSADCQALLQGDFAAHGYGTDFVERLNSELTAGHCRRGPARNMSQAARKSLLAQTVVVHRAHGGEPPLAPGSLQCSAQRERLLCNPLQISSLPSNLAITDDVHADLADSAGALVPLAEGSRNSPSHAGASTPQSFGQVCEFTRPSPAALTTATPPPKVAPQRRGLNPFLLERNKFMKGLKQVKGRTLTEEEIQQGHQDFKQVWERMDKDVFAEAYQEWRSEAPTSQAKPVVPYIPIWGGGCHATPITKEEMHQHITENGWPTSEEIRDEAGGETRAAPDTNVNLESTAGFNLFGISRQARNIDRSATRAPEVFDFVEKGIHNYLSHVGRDAAQAGDILLIIDGPALDGGGWCRMAFLVTGTSFNPKVFDITMLDWMNEEASSAEVLVLPTDVKIASRLCRVGRGAFCIDTRTSDELIDGLLPKMSRMHLSRAAYDPIFPDGTLLWSRITGAEAIGELWRPGMRDILKFRTAGADQQKKANEKLMAKMRSEDPFSDEAQRRLARGVGTRGRGSGARGRASAQRGGRGRGSATQASGCRLVGAPPDAAAEQILALENLPAEAPAQEEYLDVADDASSIQSVADMEIAFELPSAAPAAASGDQSQQCAPPGTVNPDGDVAEVARAFAAAVVSVGLGEDCPAPLAQGSGGSSGSREPPPAPDAAASGGEELLARPVWETLPPPSASGYVYSGGRMVCRIQRDKPKGSVTISCYRHRGCSLMVSQKKAPEDAAVFRWLYEVTESARDSSAEENRVLRDRHMALGRAAWYASRPAAA